MNNQDPILDAAEQLDREQQPMRDLWPDIAARLDERAQPVVAPSRHRPSNWRRPRTWLAAAAVLTAIILAPRGWQQDTLPADVASLDHDYATARADLISVMENRCLTMPATACAPFLNGLAILDRTAEGLSTALAAMPADAPERPTLVANYRSTLDRTRSLHSRAARLR